MKLRRMHSAALAFCVLGCASSGSIPVGSGVAKPKPENCAIEVYAAEADVKRPFERLCVIDARTGSGLFEDKSPEAALAHAKREACRCGADALILTGMKRQGVTWTAWGKSEVKAFAIRFTNSPEEQQ